MNTVIHSASGGTVRRRVTTALAAVGALLFSSGLVLVTAPAASAASVGICHAPATVNNPYVFQTVDTSSTADQAHYEHALDAQYTWGAAGAWWNGAWYPPNAPRPDLVPGVTLPEGTVVTRAFCHAAATLGPIAVSPAVTWQEPSCANENTAAWSGTAVQGVSYALTSGAVSAGQAAVVTATLEAGYVLADSAVAVFPHTFGAAADCRGTVAPQAPTVVQPSCTGPGTSSALSVTTATGPEGVSYAFDPETLVVTATVTDSALKLVASDALATGWVRVDDDTATYQVTATPAGACLVPVQGAEPQWVEAGCDTDPRVDYTAVTGVRYTTVGTAAPGELVTVTAHALENHVLAAGETASWSHTFDARPTGADCPGGEEPVEDIVVSPLAPTSTAASCDRDGRLVVPTQPSGVLVTRTGTAPGEVTFTFAPQQNYAFPEGTDTEVTVTVPARLTGDACILGDDDTVPEPDGKDKDDAGDVKPAVLGSQAAVPTAVAAGLSGGHPSTAATIGSPRLAQALVAGGLLMLIAAGSTGLGRRPRGAHES